LAQRRALVDKEIDISISKQCSLMSLHRSGIYFTPEKESKENLAIMEKLDKQYFLTPFYGIRRLTAWLSKEDHQVNRKQFKRLMGLVGWQTIYRVPKTTVSDKTSYKYPYLLKNLSITRPNQVWAMDIT